MCDEKAAATRHELAELPALRVRPGGDVRKNEQFEPIHEFPVEQPIVHHLSVDQLPLSALDSGKRFSRRRLLCLLERYMQKTALLFAGQGAQAVGMGRDLVERFPTAQTLFERANETLGYDLASVCFNGPELELKKTENAQPGIFVVSWAAFCLLRERCPTLRFEAAAGLSLGEFTALAAVGAMSFEDGLKVVHSRGQVMHEACEVTHGTMAAIMGLDEATTRQICEEAGVVLANLNCPAQLVISGESDRISKACELAQLRGAKRALALNVAGAYHSPLMASAQPKLAAALATVEFKTPPTIVVSNVTAQPHGSPVEIRQRLVEQVTASVRWEDSMRFLLGQGFTDFIELGPGAALSGFLRRIDKSARVLNVADTASLDATCQALAA